MAKVLKYLQGQIQLQISSLSTSLTLYDSLSNSLIFEVESVGIKAQADAKKFNLEEMWVEIERISHQWPDQVNITDGSLSIPQLPVAAGHDEPVDIESKSDDHQEKQAQTMIIDDKHKVLLGQRPVYVRPKRGKKESGKWLEQSIYWPINLTMTCACTGQSCKLDQKSCEQIIENHIKNEKREAVNWGNSVFGGGAKMDYRCQAQNCKRFQQPDCPHWRCSDHCRQDFSCNGCKRHKNYQITELRSVSPVLAFSLSFDDKKMNNAFKVRKRIIEKWNLDRSRSDFYKTWKNLEINKLVCIRGIWVRKVEGDYKVQSNWVERVEHEDHGHVFNLLAHNPYYFKKPRKELLHEFHKHCVQSSFKLRQKAQRDAPPSTWLEKLQQKNKSRRSEIIHVHPSQSQNQTMIQNDPTRSPAVRKAESKKRGGSASKF